jgi:ABC-type cobalamin/Fe3+-siderophores transport system ATPase subunit
MIKSLRLRFGKASSLVPETINCTPITVFVGPNSSGKSKILQELHRFCQYGETSSTDVILDTLEFESCTNDEAEKRIDAITLRPGPSEEIYPDHMLIGRWAHRLQITRDLLLEALCNPNAEKTTFCQCFLKMYTILLGGRNRFDLAGPTGTGDLKATPQSSFQRLFQDDVRRAEWREIVHQAFGVYPVIDPTNVGTLQLRLSTVPPPSPITERGFHNEAVLFHAAAQPRDSASDGIKAFTGIMTEVIAGEPSVLLIDEPEAFLHPGVAFVLGREISRATAGSERRLFASTHSPNFVMGCVQSGVPITLIRLTYRNGVPTARVLASADILRLMRNPLLRSTSVLAGLFHENVVVTESDADRAFYQEINERLVRDRPEDGIPNCLFLNAQNKQTVPTIVRPLRELGIAAAGIVDIDVIKDGGTIWTSAMNSAFLPELDGNAMSYSRAAAKQKFEATGLDMKRDGGVALLKGPDREAIENLFSKLAEYGLFVVPGGELESWLKNLGATGHGPSWLVDMFKRLGEDPASPSYIGASKGDVWDFIRSLQKWFANPNRRGIPT